MKFCNSLNCNTFLEVFNKNLYIVKVYGAIVNFSKLLVNNFNINYYYKIQESVALPFDNKNNKEILGVSRNNKRFCLLCYHLS